MATKFYYFDGPVKWAKVQPQQLDRKYNKYSINVYLDDVNLERFKESGSQTEIKTDDDGTYVQFKRDNQKLIKGELVEFGVPEVFLKDDQGKDKRFEGNIGNDSVVTVKVAIYDGAKGKGSRLESVRIDELVEYEPNKVPSEAEAGVDMPW